MPAKLVPAKLTPLPQPAQPLAYSDSEESSESDFMANNSNFNNNINNGGNYNDIGLTVINVPDMEYDRIDLDIPNNGSNNNDNKVTFADENNTEEQEKELIFNPSVGESESVVSETITEDEKEDEDVLEQLDTSRLDGFLRTSVYDLQLLVNTEAQNLVRN